MGRLITKIKQLSNVLLGLSQLSCWNGHVQRIVMSGILLHHLIVSRRGTGYIHEAGPGCGNNPILWMKPKVLFILYSIAILFFFYFFIDFGPPNQKPPYYWHHCHLNPPPPPPPPAFFFSPFSLSRFLFCQNLVSFSPPLCI